MAGGGAGEGRKGVRALLAGKTLENTFKIRFPMSLRLGASRPGSLVTAIGCRFNRKHTEETVTQEAGVRFLRRHLILLNGNVSTETPISSRESNVHIASLEGSGTRTGPDRILSNAFLLHSMSRIIGK